MENIMTSHNSPGRRQGLGRTLGLGLGLTLALLANLGDRAFSASTANSGIDPLQVLDVAVKNNILFVVGQSASMAGTVEASTDVVGGDDPASRFYQVKKTIREVIGANAGKANFGLATFQPEADEHRIDGTKNLIYVTQDPTGDNYRNNFVVSGGSSLAVSLGVAFRNTAGASVYTSTAYTPTANSLLVAFIVGTATTPTDPTTVTGHGITYSKVVAGTPPIVVAADHGMSVWVAKALATPTSAGVSATWGSNRSSGAIVEYVVTGADVSGTALNAIAQSPTTSGTGTSALTTLAAASNTKNAVLYFVTHAANETTLAGAGWTLSPPDPTLISYTAGAKRAGNAARDRLWSPRAIHQQLRAGFRT